MVLFYQISSSYLLFSGFSRPTTVTSPHQVREKICLPNLILHQFERTYPFAVHRFFKTPPLFLHDLASCHRRELPQCSPVFFWHWWCPLVTLFFIHIQMCQYLSDNRLSLEKEYSSTCQHSRLFQKAGDKWSITKL